MSEPFTTCGAGVRSKIRSLYIARKWRTPWPVGNWCSSRMQYLFLKTAFRKFSASFFCPQSPSESCKGPHFESLPATCSLRYPQEGKDPRKFYKDHSRLCLGTRCPRIPQWICPLKAPLRRSGLKSYLHGHRLDRYWKAGTMTPAQWLHFC